MSGSLLLDHKMIKRNKLTIFLIVIICLGFAFQPLMVLLKVHGEYVDTIYSKYSTNVPILNGVIGEDWEDANVYENVGDDNTFTVYLMHAENYLYIGVHANDLTEQTGDQIAAFFDEVDDGDHGSGSGDNVLTNYQEDYKAIDGDGTSWDGFWSSPYWWIFPSTGDPSQINFEVAIDYYLNYWEAEFKIPFQGVEDLNDESDLNVTRADVIGILLCFRQQDWTFKYYPVDGNYSNPLTWLALAFDDEAPNVTNITYSPTHPGPNDAVTVTANVTDTESGIKDVVLSYSTNGGVTWTNVVMSNITSYSGTIPKQAEDTIIQFKIIAQDNASFTTESGVSSYKVETLIFGIDPLTFYIIVGILIVSVVGVVIFLVRSRKPEAPLPPPPPLQPMPPLTTSAYCIKCGTVLKPEASFCPNCGKKVI